MILSEDNITPCSKEQYSILVDVTSILKVLLKQYKSPTSPNKFPRGVTPTNMDQSDLKVEVDEYYVYKFIQKIQVL